MKAIAIEKFGGAEQLKVMDLPQPVPNDDEVLIDVAAASVNPVDWKIREGYLKDMFPHQFPLIPGWDAAGTIVALGKNVRDFAIGDRVYGYARKPQVQWGTYAEYVTMDATAVAPIPKNVNLEQAAAIPLTGLTAYQALFDFAQLRAGQTILIHGGAGGVGGIAIQLARHAGATVVTTASAHNHSYVKQLGAQIAIDYRSADFAEAIRRELSGSVDVVFDTIGGDVQRQSYEILKSGGTLVSIADTPDEKTAKRYGVRAGFVFVSPNGVQLRELARLIESGAVKPPQIEQLRLEEAAAAHAKSAGRHVTGKIVLTVN